MGDPAHACKYTSEHKVFVARLFTSRMFTWDKLNDVAIYCKKRGEVPTSTLCRCYKTRFAAEFNDLQVSIIKNFVFSKSPQNAVIYL